MAAVLPRALIEKPTSTVGCLGRLPPPRMSSRMERAAQVPISRRSVDTEVSGGLAVGYQTAAPAAGRILMAQSTGPVPVPTGTAVLAVELQTNGKQMFYIRFDDGTFVKIAESVG